MSINYSIAMLGNPIDEDAPKKAYAKSQYTNILTLDKFAGHIASHGSKYNRADIYAVLMQTVDCMREMLLEGKRIEMGDLGVFSISIQSRGAENLETFNPAIHIEQLNVNWTPGDRFRNLLEDILDTGVTLSNLVPMLKMRNPSSVKICTILDKPSRRKADIQPDYEGFQVPDEFVVGYGLDYDEKYRNLPYVGVLKPEIYTK